MRRFLERLTVLTLLAATVTPAFAADNELSEQEKRDGWVLLFDGKSPQGWVSGGKPLAAANVRDGAINAHKTGAYVTYHREKFSDFVLSCDFKLTSGGNSGIFVHVGDRADPVQTGLEIQLFDSAGREKPGKHDSGALYDAVAPTVNAARPAGEWNHVEITVVKNVVRVVLNGKQVVDTDLDRWTEPGKNPDGTKNKFKTALKDMPREGHVGLQDHNSPVLFKNIRIKRMKAER